MSWSRLNQYEKAARKLCVIRGLDPDEEVGLDNDHGYAIYIRGTRWKQIALEIEKWIQIQEVLNESKGKFLGEHDE